MFTIDKLGFNKEVDYFLLLYVPKLDRMFLGMQSNEVEKKAIC